MHFTYKNTAIMAEHGYVEMLSGTSCKLVTLFVVSTWKNKNTCK